MGCQFTTSHILLISPKSPRGFAGVCGNIFLLKCLKKLANQHPEMFAESPADTLRRNVFTTPYAEEDVSALCEHFGASQVLMGSDWPHGEGLAEPLEFVDLLADLSESDRRCVLSTNLSALLQSSSLSDAT